jgi:glycosyltransferase involved in cell wall biosynthesis
MYPRFSETFIVTEMLAHEAAGLDLSVLSLRYPIDGRFHESLARLRAPVSYVGPETVKCPEFWGVLSRVGRSSPGLWEAAADAPWAEAQEVFQAALVAEAVASAGITHLHAHFATSAATVAMLAARAAGVGFSFTAHAKDIFADTVDRAALRAKLRAASGVVTVSDFNLRFLRQEFAEDAARVRRIYNGLDLDEFAFESPARREPLVLGVGRLVEKKGFEDLIDACAALGDRPYRCAIIGDGPLAPALRQRIAARGLEDRVRLLGPLPRSEVIRHMRSAAALAAPCVIGADGNRDGLPTVLLEAMALGTPCVSTDVTGIPEVVRHGVTGLITPEHDAPALADALGALLGDADLRVSLAREARALVETSFDIHANCARMRTLFGARERLMGVEGVQGVKA